MSIPPLLFLSYWTRSNVSVLGPSSANAQSEMATEQKDTEGNGIRGGINTTDDKPSLWVRYVDDTFTIWPHGPEKLKRFPNHLNSQNDSIQITIEKEDNNCLPLLDALMTKRSSHITITIYRQLTHRDRYLHYQSYHQPRIKNGIIKCLSARDEKLCRELDITREKISP